MHVLMYTYIRMQWEIRDRDYEQGCVGYTFDRHTYTHTKCVYLHLTCTYSCIHTHVCSGKYEIVTMSKDVWDTLLYGIRREYIVLCMCVYTSTPPFVRELAARHFRKF